MSSPRRTCCVPHCFNYGERFARIPIKNADLYKVWLEKINNPELLNMPREKVQNRFYVCYKHFENKWIKKAAYPGAASGPLYDGAYPTLYLSKEDGHTIVKQNSADVVNEEIKKLDKMCRSCMRENLNLQSLFENSKDDKVQLSEMFTNCTTIQISVSDNLPGTLCLKCIQELHIAYNFKKRCEESDVQLKQNANILVETQKTAEEKETVEREINLNKTQIYSNELTILTKDIKTYSKLDNKTVVKCESKTISDPSSGNKTTAKRKIVTDKIKMPICKLCHKVFTQASSLVVHMKRHNGEKDYKCDFCPKAFTTSGSLTIHVRSHTGERPYECGECKKLFVTNDSLNKHRKRHSGERSHLCCVCGKGFGAAGTLQVHMRVHSGDKPHKCKICDVGFAAYASLSMHVRKHTGEKPYLCSQCGKGFNSSSNLTAHTRKHTGERPFPCEICGKRFRTSYIRSVHKRVHTGEKPAQCSVCQKCFMSNGHLSIHLRSHYKTKQHICRICSRGFATLKDLTLHLMVHTGQRPHVCSECGKGFNRANNLAKHVRSHSGIKPYVCETCKYAFGTSTQLKIHIRSHTGEKPYNCTTCDKKFASSSGLARHNRRQHSNKTLTKQEINQSHNLTEENNIANPKKNNDEKLENEQKVLKFNDLELKNNVVTLQNLN